jgi:hypothetical protein
MDKRLIKKNYSREKWTKQGPCDDQEPGKSMKWSETWKR